MCVGEGAGVVWGVFVLFWGVVLIQIGLREVVCDASSEPLEEVDGVAGSSRLEGEGVAVKLHKGLLKSNRIGVMTL
jgi:hypothetical protein